MKAIVFSILSLLMFSSPVFCGGEYDEENPKVSSRSRFYPPAGDVYSLNSDDPHNRPSYCHWGLYTWFSGFFEYAERLIPINQGEAYGTRQSNYNDHRPFMPYVLLVDPSAEKDKWEDRSTGHTIPYEGQYYEIYDTSNCYDVAGRDCLTNLCCCPCALITHLLRFPASLFTPSNRSSEHTDVRIIRPYDTGLHDERMRIKSTRARIAREKQFIYIPPTRDTASNTDQHSDYGTIQRYTITHDDDLHSAWTKKKERPYGLSYPDSNHK